MLLNMERKDIVPDIIVLELAGRFALGREAQRVQWQVEELVRQNARKVILDLAGVELIDSMAIGVILFCSGKLQQSGGELRLAGARGVVDQTLRLTKVDSVVGMYPTAAAAAEGFSAPGQVGQHA